MTDEMIIAAFRKDEDPQWIGLLYQRYSALVLAVCFKYMGSAPEAEDAAMDVFENLGSKLKRHELSNFRAWLHRVTSNACLMKLRKQKLGSKAIPIKEELLGSSSDEGMRAKELQEQQWSAIAQWMERLGEDQRNCIEAFYLKEQSYEEIAADQGMALKKVKSHIQNGRRRLQIWADEYRRTHGAG